MHSCSSLAMQFFATQLIINSLLQLIALKRSKIRGNVKMLRSQFKSRCKKTFSYCINRWGS